MADLTYLMNADPSGATNQFYTLARQYFAAAGSTVVDAPTKGQTIEGIFNDLKTESTAQGTINIVSHAVGFGGIEGPITLADQANGRTMTIADDMQDALANKTLAASWARIITDKTRIVLYGCDVGRSLNFLKLLAGLFGNPGELLAPRRLSMFKLDGSTVKYRQAQSWTLVRKAHLTPAGANEPTGGWPAFRTQFVKDASDKFGRAAILSEIDGDNRFTAILTTAANSATKVIGPTFFLEETLDIFPTGTQTAKQAADSVKPLSNGDPVTATAQSAAQVDDTTVVTTVSGADAYPAKARQDAILDHTHPPGANHRSGRAHRGRAGLCARDQQQGTRAVAGTETDGGRRDERRRERRPERVRGGSARAARRTAGRRSRAGGRRRDSCGCAAGRRDRGHRD